jgi:hypothetical protein
MARLINNAKIKKVMETYVAFLRSEPYRKIEDISDNSVNAFSTSKSRELVKAVRRFAGFADNAKISSFSKEKGWFRYIEDTNAISTGKNAIYPICAGPSDTFSITPPVPNNRKTIISEWFEWADAEVEKVIPANADKVKELECLWLFANCARSISIIKQLLLLIINAGESDKKSFSESEISRNFRQFASQLNDTKQLTDLMADTIALYSVIPGIPEFKVLKWDKSELAGWTKNTGFSDLMKAKEDLGSPIDLTQANVLLVNTQIMELMNSLVSKLDQDLAGLSETQVRLLGQIIAKSVPSTTSTNNAISDLQEITQLDPQQKAKIKVDMLKLSICKTQLYEQRSNTLKMLMRFLKDKRINLAEIEKFAARVQASASVLGAIGTSLGAGGLTSDPVSLISGAAGAIVNTVSAITASVGTISQSNAAYPVSITEAFMDELASNVTRLSELANTLYDNYRDIVEIYVLGDAR